MHTFTILSVHRLSHRQRMSVGKFSFPAGLSLEVLFLILPRCCLLMHAARSCMITGSICRQRFRKSLVAFHNNAINLIRYPRILHSRIGFRMPSTNKTSIFDPSTWTKAKTYKNACASLNK